MGLLYSRVSRLLYEAFSVHVNVSIVVATLVLQLVEVAANGLPDFLDRWDELTTPLAPGCKVHCEQVSKSVAVFTCAPAMQVVGLQPIPSQTSTD